MKTIFVMIVFLTLGCTPLGCAHVTMPTGMITGNMPANLYCVSHDKSGSCIIYRSAQPSAAEFSAMVAKLGLRSVVKLNLALEARDNLPGGVEPFENPWLPAGPVTDEQVTEALTDIYWAPKPVLIHCTHGEDRTSLAVGLWRIKYEHVSPAAAWGEMRAYGFHTDLLGLVWTFTHETGWRP